MEHLKFSSGQLSESSIRLLKKKMDKLLLDFNELVELDRKVTGEPRHAVWHAMFVRPWTFSVINGYRRMRMSP